MTRIYCFINNVQPSDWNEVMAMSEHGEVLASHISSNLAWAKHDIGLTSDWQHDIYSERHPDGFELEWVDDPTLHPGLMAAYLKNQVLGEAKR